MRIARALFIEGGFPPTAPMATNSFSFFLLLLWAKMYQFFTHASIHGSHDTAHNAKNLQRTSKKPAGDNPSETQTANCMFRNASNCNEGRASKTGGGGVRAACALSLLLHSGHRGALSPLLLLGQLLLKRGYLGLVLQSSPRALL